MKTDRPVGTFVRRRPWPTATAATRFWALLMLTLPTVARAQDPPIADILGGRWAEVENALQSVTPATPSAVLRMIKGHACLALNHNNESLGLFASALNDAARQTWQTWADQLATDHPKNAIAWYLKGDAAARQKDWPGAATCLDKAIALDDKCYLALNARGVVHHAAGSTIKAQEYFDAATNAKQDFADAHASKGTCYVFRNTKRGSTKVDEDSRLARAAFESAQEHTKDQKLAIAIIGRGCALSATGQYDSARSCFLNESLPDPLLPLARRNLLANEFDVLRQTARKAEAAGVTLRAAELQQTPREVMYQSHNKDSRIEHFPPCRRFVCVNEDCSKVIEVTERVGKDQATQPTAPVANVNEALLPTLSASAVEARMPVLPDFDQLAGLVNTATAQLQRQLALVPDHKVETPVQPREGGLTTKDIADIRTRRGGCGACNVYGLLYAVRLSAFGNR